MPSFVRMVLLAAVIALLTVFGGWWAVPLAGLAWGAMGQRASLAFVAGLLGWGALLGWQAFHGPVYTLAERLVGILPLPAWGVVAAGPVFAGLLAWSAAEIGSFRSVSRPGTV